MPIETVKIRSMKRKKSRPQQNPVAPPSQVLQGDVFATFVHEATSIGSEVRARRTFCQDAVSFLSEKGLTQEFEAWQAARTRAV